MRTSATLADRYLPADATLIRAASEPSAEFLALADWWHEATDALSAPSKKVSHRAYRQIIAMGRSAVPYILMDLRDRGGYWFYALEAIEGAVPLPKRTPVPFAEVKEAWLDWGRAHNMI